MCFQHSQIVLFAVLAVSAAAPKPGVVLAYSSPVVSSVVHPAVSSYSSYSNSVVHGSPVVPLVPVVHQPVVHSVPLAYSAPVHTLVV